MRGYRGNIIFAPVLGELVCLPQHTVVVEENGKINGVYSSLPHHLEDIEIEDYGDKLIIPAFTDLHLHSSQLPNRAMGYDGAFSQWLTQYTYPAERMYAKPEYAHKVNGMLISELIKNGIMRSVIMSSVSLESTADLMEQFIQSGLSAYIGKMNSDLGAFGKANETTEASKRETLELIARYANQNERVHYILSPEFIPCCTDEMMVFLGELALSHKLPVQSHIAESPWDVGAVAARYPKDSVYAAVYRRFGLFGQMPTVMAHCLYNTDAEIGLMAEHHVYAAHCPVSNMNVPSGRQMPLRRFLESGIPVGLGSDVAGGHTLSMLQNMVAAVQISKQYAIEYPQFQPICVQEAFYLATKGGGSFFGKVGSFEPDYEFDALIVDDSTLDDLMPRTLSERLVRFIYRGDDRQIKKRFCGGREIPLPML